MLSVEDICNAASAEKDKGGGDSYKDVEEKQPA
jgi:hypothetical protein